MESREGEINGDPRRIVMDTLLDPQNLASGE
jgi:hypothetical protein